MAKTATESQARIGHRSVVVILRAAVLLAALAAPAGPALCRPDTLRVGLIRCYAGARELSFTPSRGSLSALASTQAGPLTVRAGASGIEVADAWGAATQAGTSISIAATDPAAVIAVSSPGRLTRRYRGAMEVSLASDALRLVNVVKIEDYLQGVVPIEMPESYPEEALKVQAIAARTYALRNLGKHKRDGYDLCDTTNCQGYGGAVDGKPRSVQAVIDTRGMVLTYNGELACVLYSTDCGGATENQAEARSGPDIPYLCGVKEPPEIAHVSWEKTYTLQELAETLKRAGIDQAQGLTGIAIRRTSASGRALEVEIAGPSGKCTITGTKLREILGQNVLKSTLMTIELSADAVTFRGTGFGHGFGLCQTGAKALALPPFGYSCRQILDHYYPGTQVQSLEGSTPARPVVATGPPPARTKGPSKATAGISFDVRVKAPGL